MPTEPFLFPGAWSSSAAARSRCRAGFIRPRGVRIGRIYEPSRAMPAHASAAATPRNISKPRAGQQRARLGRCGANGRRNRHRSNPMKSLSISALIYAAFIAFPAVASAPLDYDDARHLLNRTGFGASDAEIRRMVGMTREEAARSLLAGTRATAVTTPPAWTNDAGPLRYPRGENASDMEKKQFQQEQIRDGLELRGWWPE